MQQQKFYHTPYRINIPKKLDFFEKISISSQTSTNTKLPSHILFLNRLHQACNHPAGNYDYHCYKVCYSKLLLCATQSASQDDMAAASDTTNPMDEGLQDLGVPVPVQTFLWQQIAPFIRPKLGKLHEASCMVSFNVSFIHAFSIC